MNIFEAEFKNGLFGWSLLTVSITGAKKFAKIISMMEFTIAIIGLGIQSLLIVTWKKIVNVSTLDTSHQVHEFAKNENTSAYFLTIPIV